MANFNRELRALAKAGALTTADLAQWFETPYATMRTWVHDMRVTRGISRGLLDGAVARLADLKKAVDRGRFPVPASETALTRPAYVRKVRDEHIRRSVPRARPANKRVQMRDGRL